MERATKGRIHLKLQTLSGAQRKTMTGLHDAQGVRKGTFFSTKITRLPNISPISIIFFSNLLVMRDFLQRGTANFFLK